MECLDMIKKVCLFYFIIFLKYKFKFGSYDEISPARLTMYCTVISFLMFDGEHTNIHLFFTKNTLGCYDYSLQKMTCFS
jgi:hypothetical protein